MKMFQGSVLTLTTLLMSLTICSAQQIDPLGEVPFGLEMETDGSVSLEMQSAPEVVTPAQTVTPATSNGFLGLDDDNTSIPPDTMGAVGPNHVVTMLNTQVRVQNRAGTTNYSTVSLNSWWSSAGSFTRAFDPRVAYDPYEGRWIAVAVTDEPGAASSLLIGASQTDDPTGTWYRTKIDADSGDTTWADYPSVGFNKNWIVVQANMFSVTTGNFVRSKVFMFNKTNVYAGGVSRVVTNLASSLGGVQVPAVTYDTNVSTLYLLQAINGNTTNRNGARVGLLRLWRVTGTPAAPLLRATTNYPSTRTTWADWPGDVDFARQSNTTVKIRCGDGRLQNVVYRNGDLWCTHTVFYPTNNPTRSAVQWWQISTTGVSKQVARIHDSSGVNFYAFPSIGVNRFGDVLVGYSRFSSNQFASANYAFRNFYDSVNTMGTDTVLKAGEGVYYKTFGGGRNRWGDYSATWPDPLNDIDFWTVQEYAATPVSTGLNDGNGRWGTWWGHIALEVPSNDHFTNALAISGSTGSVTNTNYRGTKEPGEPNHAGNAGGKSLWYSWTAPNAGQVTISTVGSTFNTTLGIYTGTSIGSLTTITNDNDSGGSLTSRAIFTAVSNTTYKIAVDGLNGASATVVLNWSQPAPPMIVAQPESTNVVANANENANFSVIVIGNPVPASQWKFNGANISGATGSSYSITNVQTTHAGDYTVVCTNTSGSVTSSVATLFVHADSAARLNLIGYNSTSFWFQIYGLTNRPYRVETTTNLTSPITWTSAYTNNVSYFYTNFVTTNDVTRFYRAITNSL